MEIDPLRRIVPDVFDLIFHHLTTEELLKLSEVSKLWNGSVGDNSGNMRKFCLNLTYRMKLLNSDVKSVSTHRRYRNICADLSQFNESEVVEVLSRSKNFWQRVELSNGGVWIRQFLVNFNETVKILTLNKITSKVNRGKHPARQRFETALINTYKTPKFSQLERLTLFSCCDDTEKIFRTCKNLKTLRYLSSQTSENLRQILTNNEKLEQLQLIGGSFNSFVPHHVLPQIKFQLTELKIIATLNKEDRRCLEEFLNSQSSSLKVISIDSEIDSRILFTCLKMSKLLQLSCKIAGKFEESTDWCVEEFRGNSIHRLDISCQCQNLFERIFEATPDLAVFKTDFIDDDILKSLMNRCGNLEELYVENFDVEILPSGTSFSNLKRFKALDVNENLLNSLKKKAGRNSFEEFIVNH
jgi:hypothetical protein